MGYSLKLLAVMMLAGCAAAWAQVQARPPSPTPPAGSVPAPPGIQAGHPAHHRQKQHAGDWLRRFKDLPLDQQEKALENDPVFRRLNPDRQAKLREQLHKFSALPADKQQRILTRMETWEHLTPAQKQRAKEIFARIRRLPPDRRKMVRAEVHNLRQMDPQRRQHEIESEDFRGKFSPEERELVAGIAQLPLAPPTPNQPETSSAPESH